MDYEFASFALEIDVSKGSGVCLQGHPKQDP